MRTRTNFPGGREFGQKNLYQPSFHKDCSRKNTIFLGLGFIVDWEIEHKYYFNKTQLAPKGEI